MPRKELIELETRKTDIIAAKRHRLMMQTLLDTKGAAFGSISAMPGRDFAGSAGLQAELPRAFPAFVEDQPVEVASEVAKGQFCLGAAADVAVAFNMGLSMSLRRWIRLVSIRSNNYFSLRLER